MFSGHGKIRIKSLCIFEKKNEIFVSEMYDSVKKDNYYRPIGGTVEFGEHSIETLKREIAEELDTEIIEPTLYQVFESVFICDGKSGHEIVFMYKAKFKDKQFYEKKENKLTESNGEQVRVVWVPIKHFFSKNLRLVPDKLLDIYEKEHKILL